MKLGRKDYTISVKTGTDANKSKFKKEAVQGEMYFATDSKNLYVAETTAGAIDATLSQFEAPFLNAYSVDFDGTNDRMDVGSGLSLSGSSTVSLWFRRTGSVSGYGGSLIATTPIYRAGFENTFAIALKNGTDVTLESYDNQSGSYTNTVASGVVSTNTWYHLALVLTSTDASTSSGQFYLDGSTIGSAISLSGRTLEGLNEGFVVASYQLVYPTGYNYFFPGQVDEVSVFDSALSAPDITAIYNSGTPDNISSLSPVGWWRMGDNDGASGTTITDQGSGGNNGTLTNGPTFSTTVPS